MFNCILQKLNHCELKSVCVNLKKLALSDIECEESKLFELEYIYKFKLLNTIFQTFVIIISLK